MKIDKVNSVSLANIKQPKEVNPKNGSSFEKVKNEIANFLLDKSSPLNEIENKLINVKNLSGKDLLGLQIRASNYHIKVEVVTKVAESVIATTKRLQQVQ